MPHASASVFTSPSGLTVEVSSGVVVEHVVPEPDVVEILIEETEQRAPRPNLSLE